MSASNYGELVTLIERYLKRSDLSDLIPDWINFASKRIDSDCRLSEQEYRTVTVANLEFLPLPLDFIEMRNIQTNFQGSLPLQYMTPGQLDSYSLRLKRGPIQFYTIVDNQLQLMPAPADDSETEIEIFYFARLPAFNLDADTNKVLLVHPQLYLYSVLIEAMPFLEHQAGTATWQQMYADMKNVLNERAERGRFSGNNLAMRPG